MAHHFAYPSQWRRGFPANSPQYHAEIFECKSFLKSVAHGVKKISSKVKHAAHKVAHFVKEHKKEILIGAAVLAAAGGIYLLSGALAGSVLATPEDTGRKREDADKPILNDSYHYASKKDIVHYGENAHTLLMAGFNDESEQTGMLKQLMENKDQLILLEPHEEAKGIDHDFESPTYDERLRQHTELYLNT